MIYFTLKYQKSALGKCIGYFSICNLEKLQFLSLPDNPNIQMLPSCIAQMPRLSVVNMKGSNKNSIPDSLKQRLETDDNLHLFD